MSFVNTDIVKSQEFDLTQNITKPSKEIAYLDSNTINSPKEEKLIIIPKMNEKRVKSRVKSRKRIEDLKKEGELWRLRCKLLSEKYFKIIRDLKEEIKTLHVSNLLEIDRVKTDFQSYITAVFNNFSKTLQAPR
jgi:hypothetical protein